MIIAVDFDGTCVDHRFPAVGPDAPGAVEVLKALVAQGDKLILWTMRCDGRAETLAKEHHTEKNNYLSDAIQWFEDRGIRLWGIQRNPQQDDWTDSPKAYANVYIDDAALGCPMIQPQGFKKPCVDWEKVAEILHVGKSEPTVSEMADELDKIQAERELTRVTQSLARAIRLLKETRLPLTQLLAQNPHNSSLQGLLGQVEAAVGR